MFVHDGKSILLILLVSLFWQQLSPLAITIIQLIFSLLGHMELKLCKYDDSNMVLNQACLDAHPLEFVQDLSYGIPKDVNHPERAYFAE